MKPKHLLFATFAGCLILSGVAYGNGHSGMSLVLMLMALASTLYASNPAANRRAGIKVLVTPFTRPQQ